MKRNKERDPKSAVTTIRYLYSLIPAGLWLLVAGSLLLYKLDKKMPQIRKDLEERRGAQIQEEV